MVDADNIPSRFFSLDVVRGVLALSIVFYHWQHFFYNGENVSPGFERGLLPLYSILTLLYTEGLNAVSFFFSLSGFMFFWLYAEPVGNKSVSAYTYTVFRFSRLYPLHVVTLCLAIIGQSIYVAQMDKSFIYPENDWYHLVLNVLFVNAWGLEKGFSFNGPAWTVSIEVLMYISFFVLAYFNGAKSVTMAIFISFIVFLIGKHVNLQIGMGFHSFFVGGVAFLLYSKLMNFELKRVILLLSPFCAVIWAIALFDIYSGVTPAMKLWAPELVSNVVIRTFNSSLFATVLVIPLTIILLAIIETARGSLGRRARIVGDLSYAIYLLHFPLQLAFILVVGWLGVDRSFFYSNTSLIAFFFVLLALSYLSYFYFELPCQKYLRRALIKK